MKSQEELIHYYQRELSYLRKSGSAFAEQYPKVAGRLALAPDECADPQVERLLESFAFLTGRIQHQIESEFPEVTTALLGVLYPQFVNPLPPMSVARFEVDPSQGMVTSGHDIPRDTPLFAETAEGLLCRFRTCYPVTLWPLSMVYAGFESTDQFDFLDGMPDVATILRLRLEVQGPELPELSLGRLRFFINGERLTASTLYDLLFGQQVRVALLREGDGAPVFLPQDAIRAVGFDPEEYVLPYPNHAHPGYRLLQEYFTFPEKFFFFDLHHLERHGSTRVLDILLLLKEPLKSQIAIDKETFCLGCAPIINLFPKTTEPIRLDHRQSEYRLVPDSRRERTTEIHSIRRISGSTNAQEDTQIFQPLYSFTHQMEGGDHQAFWHARRRGTDHSDRPGTDVYLSFQDLQFHPACPPIQSVYAHTLCSNRQLAEQIPAGGILQIEEEAPLSRITCIKHPTLHQNPPLGGQTPWRLISHLSINHLSLAGGKESLHALREIFKLYNFTEDASIHRQIMGLKQLETRRVVQHVGTDAWRGFCRGLEITLTVDESFYVGSSPILFGSVLNHFFALYASINSFTHLRLISLQREGIWKQWSPMAGEQSVL